MRLTCVKQDLISDIVKKIGSLSISSAYINDICKDKDCDEETFDIELNLEKIDAVIWNGHSLTLIREESSITIYCTRFYEAIIK